MFCSIRALPVLTQTGHWWAAQNGLSTSVNEPKESNVQFLLNQSRLDPRSGPFLTWFTGTFDAGRERT
jgi:hypothetical protein